MCIVFISLLTAHKDETKFFFESALKTKFRNINCNIWYNRIQEQKLFRFGGFISSHKWKNPFLHIQGARYRVNYQHLLRFFQKGTYSCYHLQIWRWQLQAMKLYKIVQALSPHSASFICSLKLKDSNHKWSSWVFWNYHYGNKRSSASSHPIVSVAAIAGSWRDEPWCCC